MLIPAGPVFAEGDPATCFYVLLSGTLVTSRKVGADDVEITRTSQKGVYTGAFRSYVGERMPQGLRDQLGALDKRLNA